MITEQTHGKKESSGKLWCVILLDIILWYKSYVNRRLVTKEEMYGGKACVKLVPLTEKKCYLTPKIRDVGVIAWTLEREHFLPPSLSPQDCVYPEDHTQATYEKFQC